MAEQQNNQNTCQTVCPLCDLVLDLPGYRQGYRVSCPCCNHTLREAYLASDAEVASMAFLAQILLIASVWEPFMSLGAMGISNKISLVSIVSVLEFDWTFLIWVFLIVTFACPTIVLVQLMAVGWFHYRPGRTGATLYATCHHYCMVDVFVVGVAVSLIKLTALADVDFYFGFYTCILFCIVLTWCLVKRSPGKIWNFVLVNRVSGANSGQRAISQGIYQCRSCGYCFYGMEGAACPRCGSVVHARSHQWLQRLWALLISAIVLFLPANVFPMMYTDQLGNVTGSNIVEGALLLWQMGSYFVATVILFASLMIPSFKIVAMMIIAYSVTKTQQRHCVALSRCYRVVEFIGKWSMIDVFVVILMATAVRMDGILTIHPGLAVIYFCLVVIITNHAAGTFDERLIWDKKEMYAGK